MILPTEKSKPKEINPRTLLLYGKPKSGKTTIVANLDNALILDLDNGTDYLECMAVKVKTLKDLREIAIAIEKAGKPYKYLVIDKITQLVDIAAEKAMENYLASGTAPNDPSKIVKHIIELPKGLGHWYIWNAVSELLDYLKTLAEYTIILGDSADKQILDNSEEQEEITIDLSRKLGNIVMGRVDSVGYLYRKDNQTIISFKNGEKSLSDSRALHIRGKNIVIAESDEDNNLTIYWDKIYLKTTQNE